MPKCDICGEFVDLNKHHIYYYKDTNVVDYYTDDKEPVYKSSKNKTYEHVECSDII